MKAKGPTMTDSSKQVETNIAQECDRDVRLLLDHGVPFSVECIGEECPWGSGVAAGDQVAGYVEALGAGWTQIEPAPADWEMSHFMGLCPECSKAEQKAKTVADRAIDGLNSLKQSIERGETIKTREVNLTPTPPASQLIIDDNDGSPRAVEASCAIEPSNLTPPEPSDAEAIDRTYAYDHIRAGLGMDDDTDPQEVVDAVGRMREAMELITESRDAGRHDGLPEPHPALDADTMFGIAWAALYGTTPEQAALAAQRKGGE